MNDPPEKVCASQSEIDDYIKTIQVYGVGINENVDYEKLF